MPSSLRSCLQTAVCSISAQPSPAVAATCPDTRISCPDTRNVACRPEAAKPPSCSPSFATSPGSGLVMPQKYLPRRCAGPQLRPAAPQAQPPPPRPAPTPASPRGRVLLAAAAPCAAAPPPAAPAVAAVHLLAGHAAAPAAAAAAVAPAPQGLPGPAAVPAPLEAAAHAAWRRVAAQTGGWAGVLGNRSTLRQQLPQRDALGPRPLTPGAQ